MTENKKMMKIEGVETLEVMVFVRTKKDGTTFFSLASTIDMIHPLAVKYAKVVEGTGQKWLDVWFVKKNRTECLQAFELEDKEKYIIEKVNRVWIAKNNRGYLGLIVDCDDETIYHQPKKEAKKDAPKEDLDDLPF